MTVKPYIGIVEPVMGELANVRTTLRAMEQGGNTCQP